MDKYTLLTIATIALTAAILILMKRPISYKNQLPKLWYGDTETDQNSQHLFDMYSWTHITHGIIFYFLVLLLFPGNHHSLSVFIFIAVLLESIWEIAENNDFIINKYRSQTISLGYFGDSVSNTMGDIACCVVGVCLAHYFPVWASVGYAVVSEILLAFLIRDNMILNILMLIYPIESLKKWQNTKPNSLT